MRTIVRSAASIVAASALALSASVATELSAEAAPAPAAPVVDAGFSVADEKAYLRLHSSPTTGNSVQLPANGSATVFGEAVTASSGYVSKGRRAVRFARRQIGDRYRYGATGPSSWDCSGLTRGAWKSVGVSLPHSSRMQYKRGKRVSRSNLRKGDLVFFYSRPSHVGIYAGNGRVIHASRPGKPVGYGKISSMPYKGARRPG